MTEQQILELGPALADYLDTFLFCCDYTQTFRHLGVYCRGLLSDLQRKTAEPIALAAGTGVRSLQLFLTQHTADKRGHKPPAAPPRLAAHVPLDLLVREPATGIDPASND